MPAETPTRSLAELVRGADDDVALPRGRHSLSREQVRSTQRGRLLLAMAEAAAEKGYAQTTVADVLTRAGVSRETFYEHFANKEACFLAAYEASVGAIAGLLGERASAGGGDARERLGRLLTAYLDALASEPALARTFLVEVYAAGPVATRRRAEVQRDFADLVLAALQVDGPLAGLDDPAFAVRALVGAISSLVTMTVLEDRADELPELATPILALVDRLLAAGA